MSTQSTEQIAFRLGAVPHDPFDGEPAAHSYVVDANGSATFYLPPKAEREALALGAHYVLVAPRRVDRTRIWERDHAPSF